MRLDMCATVLTAPILLVLKLNFLRSENSACVSTLLNICGHIHSRSRMKVIIVKMSF